MSQIKWIPPTPDNVKALWGRIREGRFKSPGGLPRFQLIKDVHDPTVEYLTWTYDKSEVVRCPINDFPAYLPEEERELAYHVLERIARHPIGEPSAAFEKTASEALQRWLDEVEEMFGERLRAAERSLDAEAAARAALRQTLVDLIGQGRIKKLK